MFDTVEVENVTYTPQQCQTCICSVKTQLCSFISIEKSNYPRNESDKNKKTLSKGEMLAMDNGQTMVIAWLDTKLVTTLTNMHTAQMEETSQRKKKSDGSLERVWKPSAVIDYNK